MKVSANRKFYRDTITIEHTSDDLTVDEVVEMLLRPLLLALGYSPVSIEKALGPVNYDAIMITEDDDER